MDMDDSNIESFKAYTLSMNWDSFWGHAIPAAFCIVWSSYSAINNIIQYQKSILENVPFRSNLWHCDPTKTKFLTDINIACLYSLLMVFLMIYWGVGNGTNTNPEMEQHVIIFLSLTIHCFFVHLQNHSCISYLDVDYITFLVYAINSALVFVGHLGGTNGLNSMVAYTHSLLAVIAICNSITIAFEMAFRQVILVCLVRSYFSLLVGTWVMQIGFSLSWFVDSIMSFSKAATAQESLQVMSIVFAGHVVFNFGIMLVICIVALRLSTSKKQAP